MLIQDIIRQKGIFCFEPKKFIFQNIFKCNRKTVINNNNNNNNNKLYEIDKGRGENIF